jgi:lysophospholipase L1-like esterase
MAQSSTIYDPDSDEKPIHHTAADEQELRDFRRSMGVSPDEERGMDAGALGLSAEEESDIENKANGGGLFNSKDEDETETEESPKSEQSSSSGDDQTSKSKLKKKSTAVSSKKKYIAIGGGGVGGVAIVLILFLLLASSLKIPNLAQNITSYEFARLTRQYSESAQRTTEEELALETVGSGAEDTADSSVENGILRSTYDNASDMWSKLDVYRPDKVIQTLGEDSNLKFTVSSKGGLTGTLNDQAFTMDDPGYISSHVPVLSSIKTFQGDVDFSRQFAPALEDSLLDNEVGPIIRGIVANRIRKELGIGLIAWYVGKYQGENATEARITEEGEKIDDIDGGTTPPEAKGIVDEENNAEDAASQAAETAESTDAGLQGIIDNGGIIKGVTTAIGNSLKDTAFQDVVSITDPVAKFATPACIIYDGSLDSSKSDIDNQTKQQQAAFYYVESAADQQKAGSNYSIDSQGDGLATATMAGNDDVGDITQSNAYIRASGGSVNTSSSISAESSADGQFTFFNAIPGIPSVVVDFLNGNASSLCPALTNIYVQGVLGFLTILNTFVPGEGEAADAAAGTTEAIITHEGDSIAANVLAKIVGEKAAGYTSRVSELLADGVKNAAEIAGLTVAAKLIVLNRAGEVNSGTAQGVDLDNEADSGGNIQANELERTQLFGRPMLENEVCASNQDDQQFIAANEGQQSAFNRYLSPSDTTSLLSRTAVAVGGDFNGSLSNSMLHVSADLLRPFSLASSLSNLFFGRANAAANCDSISSDYGDVQFGWSDAEENLINSSATYDPLENDEILNDSGKEPQIASEYAACFGYTYNAAGDGSFDPTDTSGDLQLADGPGMPASLGTLLSSDGQDGRPLYIERDTDGNVIDDPNAICSPGNLGYQSTNLLALDPSANTPQRDDLVFRWRLAMQYDTTVDQLTSEQTETASASTSTTSSTAANNIVYTVGDSLTVGSEDEGNLVADLQQAGWSSDQIEATVGDTVEDALPKVQADSQNVKNAGTVIVALGTNDYSESQATFSTEITAMVNAIKQINPTAKIYWVNAYSSPGHLDMTNVNAAIAADASTDGYTIMDWQSEVTSNPGKYTFDSALGVHLTAAGYQSRSAFMVSNLGTPPTAAD